MNTRCRALLAGAALLTVALAPAACTSMGQGMAESAARANAARYAAQGNPQFSDPALQAIVKDFEARYAEIGLDAEKLGMAQRSEERRVGKEGVSKWRSRWSPYH